MALGGSRIGIPRSGSINVPVFLGPPSLCRSMVSLSEASEVSQLLRLASLELAVEVRGAQITCSRIPVSIASVEIDDLLTI